MDLSEVVTAQIRALQAIYPQAHQALVNWGRWSRDRRGIFPGDIKRPSIWDQANPNKFGDYVDEQPEPTRLPVEAKAEKPEEEPYDEKAGHLLDERIHGYGGLSVEVRRVIRIAYVTREVPEDQFHRMAGCSPDAFRERLEAALIFVGRFA